MNPDIIIGAAAPVDRSVENRSHLEFTDGFWFYWASFDSDFIALEVEMTQISQTHQWLHIDDFIKTEVETDRIRQNRQWLDIDDFISAEAEIGQFSQNRQWLDIDDLIAGEFEIGTKRAYDKHLIIKPNKL
jgi:hypothetical protein